MPGSSSWRFLSEGYVQGVQGVQTSMCCRHRASLPMPHATYWFFHDGVALACVDLLRSGGDQADTGSNYIVGTRCALHCNDPHFKATSPSQELCNALASYIKVRNAPVLCVISGNSSPLSDHPPTEPTKRAWSVHTPKNLFENQHTPFR